MLTNKYLNARQAIPVDTSTELMDLKTFSAGPLENLLIDFVAHYQARSQEDPSAHPLLMTEKGWRAALREYVNSA